MPCKALGMIRASFRPAWVVGLAAIAMLGVLGTGWSQPAPWPSDALLEAWAPVVAQDLAKDHGDSLGARGDYLTSFDFDGSWRLDNNLTNAIGYDMPSIVYAWWAETADYRVLGYTFYRVRGPEQAQNDVRSVLVVVEAPSREWPVGRFVGLALPQGDGWSFSAELDQVSRRAPIRAADPGRVPHDVDFVLDEGRYRPVIYGTTMSHDFHTEVDAVARRRPTLFEDNVMTDWREVEPMVDETDRERFIYPTEKPAVYKPLDWGVIYSPGAGAGVIARAGVRAPGRMMHNWEVVSYELEALDEFWQRRHQVASDEEPILDEFGRLVGDEPRGPGSLPPWLRYAEQPPDDAPDHRVLEASPMFFGGTLALAEGLAIEGQELVQSSLGSAGELARVAAEFGRVAVPRP